MCSSIEKRVKIGLTTRGVYLFSDDAWTVNIIVLREDGFRHFNDQLINFSNTNRFFPRTSILLILTTAGLNKN